MEMQQNYRKPVLISIVLHILVFLLLAAGFEFTGKNFVFENTNNQQIINAVVMNTMPAQQQKVAPIVHSTPPPPPAPAVQPRVMPVQKPTVTPVPKDVIALQAKKQLQQQNQIQKQLLADLNKTKAQQKKLKQKALEKAFENEVRNLSAKALQDQLKNEVRQAGAQREQKAQGQVDKYKAMVLQAIGRHWLIPSNVDKRLATQIVIFLAPGGMVLDAEIYKSSGNVGLDNSARAAVFKASPLPVPNDPEEFKFFRRFVLVFKPMYFQNGQFD